MDVTDLARDLVSIPSHESEAAAGDCIEDWLREHTDTEVTRDDAGDERRGGNVIARKGSGVTSLALVGHHDVVPPDDSQLADGADDADDADDAASDSGYVVEQRREDGDRRLYGRGSADMKGAVAAAMCAFRDADPAGELVFASFVGEEVGGAGAPGVTDVAVAHKGRRGSTVAAEGRAAHAGEPDAGTNAIYRASDAVDVVRDLDFPATEVLGHRLRGSVAVTEIAGGSAWNVVPEACEVTVDERTVPGERAPLDRVESVEGVSWDVDQDLPPMACDDAEFADRVLAVARSVHAEESTDAPGEGTPEQAVLPDLPRRGRVPAVRSVGDG
ncbi:peptidase M20 [Halobacteriales archaeon QS_5_68_33]|nr:MAG: peptidase M20 [Halobacteriales archaeon QS_5_68_33]